MTPSIFHQSRLSLLGWIFIVVTTLNTITYFSSNTLRPDSFESKKDKNQQTNKPLCSRKQIQKGYWKNVQKENPTYIYEEKWENSCYGKGAAYEGELQSPFNTWEWNTNENEYCSLSQFDVKRFCELVRGRTIAFFGDSISWQQYNSLISLTNATKIQQSKFWKVYSSTCDGQPTKIVWHRDNYATPNGLRRIIDRHDPSILVVNRGAHFTENEELLKGLNATFEMVLSWQENCDKESRECLFLWRTIAPGFPNCHEYSHPLDVSNRTLAEEIIMDQTSLFYTKTKKGKEFHWWDFSSQNSLIEDLIQHCIEVKKLRVSFIDWYGMAILRPDRHIGKNDCLHYCLPGPIDATNTILLHEMEVAASLKTN